MTQKSEQHTLKDLFYGTVTVGERGQVVIPVEARKRHGIQRGDKLLVFRPPHAPGLVMARVDDVKAVLDELQHWQEAVVRAASERDEEESEHE